LRQQIYKRAPIQGLARRDLLRAIAAASGAAMMSPLSELLAQAPKGRNRRIDVHHHMLPPFQPNMTSWHYTPQVSLDEMDKFGTDFPIEPTESTVQNFPVLRLPADIQHALDRGNAERLWPRFKQT
jgi:hypothetical protein